MEPGRFSERCPRTRGRGFTFIEIMIALVIFGLLLTAALIGAVVIAMDRKEETK